MCNMPKKLIILYTANYCNKMRNVFDVETLVKNHEVEFWNLSKITAHEKLAPAHTEGLKVIEVETHSQFRKLVKKYKKESPVYASVMGYGYVTCRVFLALTIYNSTYVAVTNGTLPSFPLSIAGLPLGKKILSLLSYLLFRTPLIKAADYALICSKKSRVFYKVCNNTIRVNSHSGDYIDAMRIFKEDYCKFKTNKYVVFLDQYLPFHGDNDFSGIKRVSENFYYKLVNEYLSKIEDKYDCEVIIAAHPSAVKYEEHNYFGGRKVIFNQTAQLVLNSLGVLTHNTTAVSYAAIYRKPIIFMSVPDLSDYDMGVMRQLAEELGSKIVDISMGDDVCFDPIKEDAYQEYKANYLSLANDNISNAQIIGNILSNV